MKGRTWSWGYLNTYQPTTKWTVDGRLHRPALRTTINGCIYYAMKRLKKASDMSVLRAAVEDGLMDLTTVRGKDMKKLVQDELRRQARWKIIKRTRRTT